MLDSEKRQFDYNTRVVAAIASTLVLLPDHWQKTLEMRAELGVPCGSVYPGVTPADLEGDLLKVDWTPYQHPAIKEGCTGFRANLAGFLGIVDLKSLPPETEIVLDDRKRVGAVSATVKGARGELVDFTVLILDKEGDTEIVGTFHPGDPIRPSPVETVPGLDGKKVTAKDAIDMGLEMAKIV